MALTCLATDGSGALYAGSLPGDIAVTEDVASSVDLSVIDLSDFEAECRSDIPLLTAMQLSLVEFKDLVVNAPLDAGRFEFVVPDGVDVVGTPVAAEAMSE